MNKTFTSIMILSVAFGLSFCSSKSENQEARESYSNSNFESNSYTYSNEEEDEESSGCKLDDDTYTATVDYNNPETGYSATYTLDVEVQDCEVVQINFPNDGYLDEDHITASELDDDGSATVYGEDGKTYDVQID